MTKTIFSVLRTSNGLPEQAEIVSTDLPLWEKIGYKKVGERVEEVSSAPVVETSASNTSPSPVAGNADPEVEKRINETMKADDFDKLPLPPRVCDMLRRAGYMTFASLKTATDEELLKLEGFGKGLLSRLRDGLDELDA